MKPFSLNVCMCQRVHNFKNTTHEFIIYYVFWGVFGHLHVDCAGTYMGKHVEMEASPSLLHLCILCPCMLLYNRLDPGQKWPKHVVDDKCKSSDLKLCSR